MKHPSVAFCTHPDWESNPPPGYMSWPGTFQCRGQNSNQLSKPHKPGQEAILNEYRSTLSPSPTPTLRFRAQRTGKMTHSVSFPEKGFCVLCKLLWKAWLLTWRAFGGWPWCCETREAKGRLSPPLQAANTCLEGRSLSTQLHPSSKGCCLKAQVPNCLLLIINRALFFKTHRAAANKEAVLTGRLTLRSCPPQVINLKG